MDDADKWIRMVATNRLTGHSKGFFSVYTLPPNQAVSLERQKIINQKRSQVPEYRNVRELIKRKSKALLKDIQEDDIERFRTHGKKSKIFIGPSSGIRGMKAGSISLVVTSPPFLDVVDYAGDNWLRCWFNHIDPKTIPISIHRKIEDWSDAMSQSFQRLFKTPETGRFCCI